MTKSIEDTNEQPLLDGEDVNEQQFVLTREAH